MSAARRPLDLADSTAPVRRWRLWLAWVGVNSIAQGIAAVLVAAFTARLLASLRGLGIAPESAGPIVTPAQLLLTGAIVGVAQADVAGSDSAAELAKCDLATEMVREFTELQGIVGGLYARAQGETEEIAWAIYDHYRPLGLDDPIPRNLTGCAVAHGIRRRGSRTWT